MKKRYCGYMLLMVVLVAMIPGHLLAARKEPFEKVRLKNGLTVMYKVMKDQPMVSIYAVVPIGTQSEKLKGIAHLTEHLVFRGGGDYWFQDIAGVTTRAGGYFNGFTSFYATAFNYVLPKERLEEGLAIFNQCLWEVRLEPNSVAMEKEIIVHELDMGYSSRYPFYPVIRYFYPEMFHSQETLAEISVADLAQFHQNFYQPDNVTYVIAGDFDPQWLTGQLEEVKNVAGYCPAPTLPAHHLDFPAGEIFESRNLYPYQYQVLMGYRLTGLTEKERMVLKLLAYMYGADYKINYQENRYQVYHAVTRRVGEVDYFGLFYLERDTPLNEAALDRDKKMMERYFHEFKKIDFKRELKNFARLIELEFLQSQGSVEAAVEYEVQRLIDPDNLTVDSLSVIRRLSQRDLEAVMAKYFNGPPINWIVVQTTAKERK